MRGQSHDLSFALEHAEQFLLGVMALVKRSIIVHCMLNWRRHAAGRAGSRSQRSRSCDIDAVRGTKRWRVERIEALNGPVPTLQDQRPFMVASLQCVGRSVHRAAYAGSAHLTESSSVLHAYARRGGVMKRYQ